MAAVPPILQGLAGPVVNVGTLGGYLSYKYGDVLPADRQPVVDPGAVRDARRRSASWQPRVRRRCADLASADRRGEAVRARHGARHRDAARVRRPGHRRTRRDVARRRDPGGLGSRIRAVARGARAHRGRLRLRPGPVRRPWLGGRHRRDRDVRGLHPQRLPQRHPRAGAVGRPDVVGVDREPRAAGRPVRLGVGGHRGDRGRGPDRHRCRGVRPPRHRPDERHPDPEPAACARRASRSGRPDLRRAASDGPGMGSGHRDLRADDRRVGSVVRRAAERGAPVHGDAPFGLPERRLRDGRWVPAAAVRRVRAGARRARGGDAGRRLGRRRDLRASRVPARDAPLATALGDGRRDRHPRCDRGHRGHVGHRDRDRGRDRRRLARAADRRHAGARPVRDGDGRCRRRDRRRARVPVRGTGRGGHRDRHLVPRHPGAGAEPAGRRARAGPDGALRAADARAAGTSPA